MKSFSFLVFCFFFSSLLFGCASDRTKTPLLIESLDIWTTESPLFWEALAKEFDAQLPDTLLNISVRFFESETALQESLLLHIAQDTAPDIVFSEANWILRHSSFFFPISDIAPLSVSKFRDDFHDVTHSLIQENDTFFVLPFGISTLGLIGKNESIQNALFDISTWHTKPLTIHEVYDLNLNLTEVSSSGESIHSAFAFGIDALVSERFHLFHTLFTHIKGSLSATERDQYDFASFQERISSSDVFRPVEIVSAFLSSFAATWPPKGSHTQLASDESLFFANKVSFLFRFPSALPNLLAHEPNLVTTFFPQLSSSSDMMALPASLFTGSVLKHTSKPELATSFLLFALQKEYQRSFFLESGIPSSRRDLFFEFQDHPVYAPWIRQIPFSTFRPNTLLSIEKEKQIFDQVLLLFRDTPVSVSDFISFFLFLENQFNESL